jgi:hypothetical protein
MSGDLSTSVVIVLALIAAASGAAGAAAISGYFNRPKTRAEADALRAQAGRTLDQRYQAWIDEVEDRLSKAEIALTEQKIVNSAMIVYTRQLRSDLEAMGAEPRPIPPEVIHYL